VDTRCDISSYQLLSPSSPYPAPPLRNPSESQHHRSDHLQPAVGVLSIIVISFPTSGEPRSVGIRAVAAGENRYGRRSRRSTPFESPIKESFSTLHQKRYVFELGQRAVSSTMRHLFKHGYSALQQDEPKGSLKNSPRIRIHKVLLLSNAIMFLVSLMVMSVWIRDRYFTLNSELRRTSTWSMPLQLPRANEFSRANSRLQAQYTTL
jgi:hypothetical protein